MTQIERLQKEGIRRLGTPKSGFRYQGPRGERIGAEDLHRIRALRVPPAWTEVRIHRSPAGKLQALGKDAAGRWQYRYHPVFRQRRDQAKYQRVIRFAQVLPKLRRQVSRDLAQPGLGRTKVLACVLRILACCFMRPGSERYARLHNHFGISTLRAKHVKVRGDTVIFDYPGKSGQRQHRELRDPQVARLVRRLLEVPGRDVFKFQADDGAIVDVKRRHINEYIKEIIGEHYSAKDFRTWAGTLICASALARSGVEDGESKTAVRRKIVAAVKETAQELGNTPAVCRNSYIYPSILSSFERRKVVDQYLKNVSELQRTHGMLRSERAVLALLRGEDGICV